MRVYVVVLAVLMALAFVATDSGAVPVQNKIFIIDLNYDRGVLSLLDVTTATGYAPDRKVQPDVGWTTEVLSFNGGVLESFVFNIPNVIIPPPPLEGEEPEGPLILEEVNFSLVIQYYSDAKSVEIYDENRTRVLSVDVSRFATCNLDSVCGGNETGDLCPSDCPAPTGGDSTLFMAGALLAVAALLGVFLVRIRKPPEG